MLRIMGMTKTFRKNVAVDNVSLKINKGEIVGLVGPNGAGKTTMIRCICSILRMDKGRVAILQKDLYRDEPESRRPLAYVPEVPYPYDYLTVEEHVEFIARAYSIKDWWGEAEELLKRFDLWDKKDKLVHTLSKGQKQKLMIVCARIHHPRVILLDEPLIGIDPKGARVLKDLVRDWASEGCCVLLSSHMLGLVEALCHRIMIMDKGKIVAEGTVEQLRARSKMGDDASFEDTFIRITEGAEMKE
jgi:ABC-2 type transport system ATP-binding protein